MRLCIGLTTILFVSELLNEYLDIKRQLLTEEEKEKEVSSEIEREDDEIHFCDDLRVGTDLILVTDKTDG